MDEHDEGDAWVIFDDVVEDGDGDGVVDDVDDVDDDDDDDDDDDQRLTLVPFTAPTSCLSYEHFQEGHIVRVEEEDTDELPGYE